MSQDSTRTIPTIQRMFCREGSLAWIESRRIDVFVLSPALFREIFAKRSTYLNHRVSVTSFSTGFLLKEVSRIDSLGGDNVMSVPAWFIIV